MRHRCLTCRNHPDLRWSCKDIAWSGYYNGCRNIFFSGTPDGQGLYSDGSGLSCTQVIPNPAYEADNKPFLPVQECSCPASDLILAPEDALIELAYTEGLKAMIGKAIA